MKTFTRLPLAMLLLALALTAWSAPNGSSRSIPRPLADHPGNVFLAGEGIVVPLPSGATNAWRLVDYRDHTLRTVSAGAASVRLGRLPVGFYRLRPPLETHSNWISLAVLAPLKAPTPMTSPVALDVAIAWFYPTQRMDAVANLCALAGVNWVRDRLSWGEIEPRRGGFQAPPTRYDASAAAQARAGLQVLQVNHISPRWAAQVPKRFPDDLRDAFRFYREMAGRWRGQVRAFEPWNEADIPMFGGHTGAEMAALQKAAFLGLKAGNADTIVGQNVFALHNLAQLTDLRDNGAAPYFDTFNLHHYEAFERYPGLYADFRAAAAGKPLWVTEAARPVKWSDETTKELSDADLREQSERLVKTFALSLHEGVAAMFYFLLPHYVEGPTQFGLLRPDLTPRPGFVALATMGRLLADARPIGQSVTTNAGVRAVWFDAAPDGIRTEVLVAWSDSGEASLELPTMPSQVFDHLGTAAEKNSKTKGNASSPPALSLTSAPVVALFPPGTARQKALRLPPKNLPRESVASPPSPLVFQGVWPEAKTLLKRSAYRIRSDMPETIRVWAYNLSEQTARGIIAVAGPAGWKISAPKSVVIPAMGREPIDLAVTVGEGAHRLVETIRLTGQFGSAGEPVLSLRLMPEPFRVAPEAAVPIPDSDLPASWRPTVSGNGLAQVTADDGRVVVSAEPAGADTWVYPVLTLAPGERPPAGATGLAFSFTLIEGAGDFRVIFSEENGSGYVVDFAITPKRGETLEELVLFADGTFGAGWSPSDTNGRLDRDRIVSVKIGGNIKGGAVTYSFGNLRWVKL